jgi:predicted dehydrogenase
MKQVAVIGAGHWGKNLVQTFYELGALAAVAESDESTRERLRTQFPDVEWYADYRDVLQTDIPAVAIATPASTHFSIARDALLCRKDVFVEKPITLSVNEARWLVDLARRSNCVLMVGHLLLYQPGIQKMKELIDKGTIGNIRSIHQERLKLGRVRSVENVLWSFGVHDIAVQHYLVGARPERVRVVTQNILPSGVADDAYLHLFFPGGIWAHLHTSWIWPVTRRTLTVIGSEGMLVFDETVQTLTLHRKGVYADLTNRDEGEEVISQSQESPLKLECKHFLECLETRATPLSDGMSGVSVVQVLQAASEHLRGKRRVARGGYR